MNQALVVRLCWTRRPSLVRKRAERILFVLSTSAWKFSCFKKQMSINKNNKKIIGPYIIKWFIYLKRILNLKECHIIEPKSTTQKQKCKIKVKFSASVQTGSKPEGHSNRLTNPKKGAVKTPKWVRSAWGPGEAERDDLVWMTQPGTKGASKQLIVTKST